MKALIEDIFKLSSGYQENIIEDNTFISPVYVRINATAQNVNGTIFDDVYIIEPLTYYKIQLKDSSIKENKEFSPSSKLLELGLMVSSIKGSNIYIYNCTNNFVYLKSDSTIGGFNK